MAGTYPHQWIRLRCGHTPRDEESWSAVMPIPHWILSLLAELLLTFLCLVTGVGYLCLEPKKAQPKPLPIDWAKEIK
jgi:hypothetical protein